MGPIQTAIGQLLGAVGGAAIAGKKMYENEGQAAKKAGEAEVKESTAEKEQKEPELAGLSAQGMTPSDSIKQQAKIELEAKKLMGEAVYLAQKKGMTKPKKMLFTEMGQAIASRDELATIISRDAQARAAANKRKNKNLLKDKIAIVRMTKKNTMAER